jgi:hypothetical protein
MDSSDTYWIVQGWRNRAWQTLFAPYLTAGDADRMRENLKKTNPACLYRTKRIVPRKP